MSTMLSTQNPEAHARLLADVPLPGVGDMVVYHLRPGEMRAGYTSVPAMVLKVDRGNRRLNLLVFYDQNDLHTLPDVPERVADNQGWVARANDNSALLREVADLRERLGAAEEAHQAFKDELGTALFGEFVKPENGIMGEIMELRDKLKPLLEFVKNPAASVPPLGKAAKNAAKAKRK